MLSLEDAGSEHQYLQASGVGSSPAEFFDQQWAIALLGRVLCRLRSEFADAGKEGLFDQLQAFLTGEKRSLSYAVLARRQQTTPAALRMMVSRMRRRYGELLREEITRTVSRPEEVDEELHALFTALTV